MPKTFTSDIGLALPSAIEGPLQIIDPADAASWIKIDPAQARIEAAGIARPQRSILLPTSRVYLSAGLTTIGSYLAARSIGAGAIGGVFFAPFRLPEDMDVSAPAAVYVLLSPVSDATTNGQVVRLVLSTTRAAADGSITDDLLNQDWPVPDDWTTSDVESALLDNGNGWTVDGDALAPGDWFGVRMHRDGPHAADTFDQGIRFSEMIVFAYSARTF